jgi:DNA primase large subunit
MRVALELKDFAKYPFLKESQEFMGRDTEAIDQFLLSESGKKAIRIGMERIKASLRFKSEEKEVQLVPSNSDKVRLAITGYVLARIIVSCTRDRGLVEKLTRFEAMRAFNFLEEEKDDVKAFVAESVGINSKGFSLPVIQYVELVAGLREERWRLVNRDVHAGQVRVTPEEMHELLRERIRVILERQLPLKVPEKVCGMLQQQTDEVTAAFLASILEQFGAVEESCFPPCIQALVAALTGGTNMPHQGRFALTAFLHNIGMNPAEIIALFCRAPDFDLQKTQYQVEHISGRGGTEYTAPSCAAMRTFGICVGSDSLCERVSHPLSYYRKKKKPEKKPEPT